MTQISQYFDIKRDSQGREYMETYLDGIALLRFVMTNTGTAGKHVVVGWYKRDRWKRLIGVVWLADEDMNLHMVDRGLAWHYKQYADQQDPSDRDAYSAAEIAALDARRGLWSDPQPSPPWEWRKR